MTKEDFIYVGIDLHKETHTAVMIDCYNNKLGEITFPNCKFRFIGSPIPLATDQCFRL